MYEDIFCPSVALDIRMRCHIVVLTCKPGIRFLKTQFWLCKNIY